MTNPSTSNIIDHLWNWLRTEKDHDAVKDVTRISGTKYDCYLNSHVSDPVSFSIFELSDRSELIIDNPQKLLESKAAYFLFVNTRTGWVVAVKNTSENLKKLATGDKIQSFKIKIIS